MCNTYFLVKVKTYVLYSTLSCKIQLKMYIYCENNCHTLLLFHSYEKPYSWFLWFHWFNSPTCRCFFTVVYILIKTCVYCCQNFTQRKNSYLQNTTMISQKIPCLRNTKKMNKTILYCRQKRLTSSPCITQKRNGRTGSHDSFGRKSTTIVG